jgi:hypothetical protein
MERVLGSWREQITIRERDPCGNAGGPGAPVGEEEGARGVAAIRKNETDKSLAAQLLGISTRTIYRKLGETE